VDEGEEDSEMNTVPLRSLWSCSARKGNSDSRAEWGGTTWL